MKRNFYRRIMNCFEVFLLTIITFTVCDIVKNFGGSGQELFHENGNVSKTGNFEGKTDDIGEILESMLHDGEPHVHSKEPLEVVDETTGSFNLELESVIHDGDGHVHDKIPTEVAGDGLLFDVIDADHLLHDGDSHYHELFKEAIDGSRPITGSEPLLFDEPKAEGVTIGTINPEDYLDYKRWKETKERASGGGWLDGFSFLSNIFRYEHESFKHRYRSTKEQISAKHDEG